jgi:hypothetical protein
MSDSEDHGDELDQSIQVFLRAAIRGELSVRSMLAQ